MSSETLIYIIIAGIIALFIALFQYWYKAKQRSQLSVLFTFLRFLTLFSILLLLINPKFEQLTVYSEKPKLIVALDNSNSIKHLKQDQKALQFLEALKSNADITKKFDLEVFTFDGALEHSDSIDFNSKETNIYNAIKELSDIYKNDIAPIVLLSDGNQTFGQDFSMANPQLKHPVFPVILGDTITYTDLRIQQLNVNKYAFLKNRFPVEAVVVYQGKESVKAKLNVKQGKRTVYSKVLEFSKTDNSKIINFTLPANSVGVSSYNAVVEPLSDEKNKINNTKNFAVEVIDQKTKIAIVSDFWHPDLGALKKSIESNEQRKVTFIDSKKVLEKINDFQLFILYQPSNRFKDLYEVLNAQNKNRFTITGTKTNLTFLNTIPTGFTHKITGHKEDFQSKLNVNFSPFIVDDINFESFPPLKSNYGDVTFNVPFATILEKVVLGVPTGQPQLVTYEMSGTKRVVLFGENLWQWRAQSFLNENSFNAFDDFIGKLVQYSATSKRKSRLNIDYESFYNGSANIVIKAQLFDKNYVFDSRKSLDLKLVDKNSNEEKILPFVLKNNNYQVDLGGLRASKYSFTVKAKDENISKSGHFEVLEYNVEQHFLNADVTKLQQLATNTKGKAFFIDNSSTVISELLKNEQFKTIQKSNKNTVPLIDWKYLLALLVLSLSVEWFLRKYNGLI